MMMRRLVIAIGLVLAGTTSSYAQLSFRHQPNKDPYRNLFTPEADRRRAAPVAAVRAKQEAMTPCVNYPMRVVPTDPTFDPEIRVTPPTNGVDHTIKTVKPPVCKP